MTVAGWWPSVASRCLATWARRFEWIVQVPCCVAERVMEDERQLMSSIGSVRIVRVRIPRVLAAWRAEGVYENRLVAERVRRLRWLER